MSSNSLKPGDKVRCVESGWGVGHKHIGETFTISEIGDYGNEVRVLEPPLNNRQWNHITEEDGHEGWIKSRSFILKEEEFSYQLTLIAKEFKNA